MEIEAVRVERIHSFSRLASRDRGKFAECRLGIFGRSSEFFRLPGHPEFFEGSTLGIVRRRAGSVDVLAIAVKGQSEIFTAGDGESMVLSAVFAFVGLGITVPPFWVAETIGQRIGFGFCALLPTLYFVHNITLGWNSIRARRLLQAFISE